MKRSLCGHSTVVAAVAVPAASAQTPVGDSVDGPRPATRPGDPCEFTTFFQVDARSGPSGENPAGTAAGDSALAHNSLGIGARYLSCGKRQHRNRRVFRLAPLRAYVGPRH